MRSRHTAISALAILVMVASVALGGRAVLSTQDFGVEEQPPAAAPVEPSASVASDVPEADPDTSGEEFPDEAAEKMPAEKPSAASRVIDPEMVAPPRIGDGQLQRAEPRPPLSDLSLAVPPKPKPSTDWKGTILFRPFASSAGVVAAQRYSVTIAGIEVVRSDETCTADGRTWNCGAHALGAFRAFLRGLSIVCAIPPDEDRGEFNVRCRSGRKDIGQWLVENGWAHAAESGPYVDDEAKAAKGRKGIFGPAPDISGLPDVPPAAGPPATEPQAPVSIIEQPDSPAPEAVSPATVLPGAMPLTDQPAPFQ